MKNLERGNNGGKNITNRKRPIILLTPLYREIILGIIVSLFIPIIYSELIISDSFQGRTIWILTLLASFGITFVGCSLCKEYRNFKNENTKNDYNVGRC
jgi:hypothetical protein